MEKLYIAYQNKKFKEAIEYTFKLLLSIFDIQCKFYNYDELRRTRVSGQKPLISYGKRKPKVPCKKHIHIYESYLFGQEYLKPESMPREPLDWYEDIPIIYRGECDIIEWIKYYRENNVNCVETNIDILASSFFMVSRYEEVVNPAEDEYQRFPASSSLAFRGSFLHLPVVNAYIELLGNWFKRIDSGISMEKLWKGADFGACLTHDIDYIRKYRVRPPIRHLCLLLRKGKLERFIALASDYIKAKIKGDPYDKFDYLMELSDKYGFGSSYYFLSGGESYQIGNPCVIKLINKIKSRGFEVGLHSSFNCFEAPEMLKEEKVLLEEVLGEQVHGVRQHYIRWKTPQCWRARVEAGFKYDTSLTFVLCEGFRCGICFPYKPFDILRNRALDIWEVPITVMEASLFDHQALSPEQVLKRTKSLIDTVHKYRGIFVLLWHNSKLNDYECHGGKDTYESILKYLNDSNFFSGSVWDIVQEWESKLGILPDI